MKKKLNLIKNRNYDCIFFFFFNNINAEYRENECDSLYVNKKFVREKGLFKCFVNHNLSHRLNGLKNYTSHQ